MLNVFTAVNFCQAQTKR